MTAPVLVIMCASGCGKTTTATLLARQLGWERQARGRHPTVHNSKPPTSSMHCT
jgi:ABC-type dipeptide/oligopeptide/nickel transport system ATPase subunit